VGPAPALLKFFSDTPLDLVKPENIEQLKLWRIKQKKRPPAEKVRK
jgi:hypothetical protein